MLEGSMTFKSVSTSGTASSKASSLFDLDENCNKSILVYKYRSGAKRLDIQTERDLCAELDKGEFACSTVPGTPKLTLMLRPIVAVPSRHEEVYSTWKQSA